GTDVGGYVLRPQEEELDFVGVVQDRQIFRVAAPPVAGLGEHRGGRLREGALVGYGDSEHVSILCRRWDCGGRIRRGTNGRGRTRTVTDARRPPRGRSL